ncbi:hypothetical protein [Streptacidiphilus sp. MAP5-3]
MLNETLLCTETTDLVIENLQYIPAETTPLGMCFCFNTGSENE